MKSADEYPVCFLSDTIFYIYDYADKAAPTFVFTYFDKTDVYYRESNGFDVADKLVESKISVNVISNYFENEPVPARIMALAANISSGSYADRVSNNKSNKNDFSTVDVTDYIYKKAFSVLTAAGYQSIILNDVLNSGGGVDTDKDGLNDWKEVVTDWDKDLQRELINNGLINIKTDSKGISYISSFPTIQECINYVINNKKLIYLEEGLTRQKLSTAGSEIPDLLKKPILLFHSNPADADTDNDGIPDFYDEYPLKNGSRIQEYNGKDEDIEKNTFTVLKEFYNPVIGTAKETVSHSMLNLPNGNELSAVSKGNQYSIFAVVLFKNEYWLRVQKSDGYGNMFYVRYDYISCSVCEEISKIKADKEKLEKEREKLLDFNGWYVPEYGLKGIDKPIPRFTQISYGPCMALCLMMGAYYIADLDVDNIIAKDYFEKYFTKSNMFYGVEANTGLFIKINEKSGGFEEKIYTENKSQDFYTAIRKELDLKNPVIIGGNNSKGTSHFVLVVGYKGNGNKQENFYIVDPFWSEKNNPDTMESFYSENRFPLLCTQAGKYYGIYKFKTLEEIRKQLGL